MHLPLALQFCKHKFRSFDSTRDIREVDVDLIDPNPLAPREVYTNAMIRAMADAPD